MGEPFIQVNVTEFMEDLDALVTKLEEAYEGNDPSRRYNLELVPYVNFLEHYKENPVWEKHIKNVESPLMRLLQLDNLFFSKKTLK